MAAVLLGRHQTLGDALADLAHRDALDAVGIKSGWTSGNLCGAERRPLRSP